MKYTPRQYAATLLTTLADNPAGKQKEIIAQFAAVLVKHRAWSLRKKIIREAERLAAKQSGLRKVSVQSAAPLSPSVHKEITQVFASDNVVLETSVVPDLLAGVTFLIDDEILIDASGRTRLKGLFQKQTHA